MQKVFGYTYMSAFIETGLSEKGAKVAATRAQAKQVGYRSPINNMFIPTARKVNGKWAEA